MEEELVTRGTFCLLPTYLDFVRKSVGSQAYQNCWFLTPAGELFDACQNGRFPCAYFVGSVLKQFGLVPMVENKVEKLVRLMCNVGWNLSFSIGLKGEKQLYFREGSVVVWEPRMGSDQKPHRHVDIYAGKGEFIGTDSCGLAVFSHDVHWTGHFHQCRKVEAVFFHESLSPRIVDDYDFGE